MISTYVPRLRLGPRVWGLSSRWLAVCPWNGSDFWIQLPLFGLILGLDHIEVMLGVSPYTVNIDIRWRWR